MPDTYEEIFEISNRNRGRNKEKKRLRDDDDDADDNAGGKWRERGGRQLGGRGGEKAVTTSGIFDATPLLSFSFS